MTDLSADIAAIRKDGEQWHGFSSQAQSISDDSGKLNLDLHNDIINQFIVTYNNFCTSFSARAKAGSKAMSAMAEAVTDVANRLQTADHY